MKTNTKLLRKLKLDELNYDYTIKETIGDYMAMSGVFVPMISCLGAGFYQGLTGISLNENPMPAQIATCITIGSWPISYIGEKISATNSLEEKMVGMALVATSI